jgi:hypothetical protein
VPLSLTGAGLSILTATNTVGAATGITVDAHLHNGIGVVATGGAFGVYGVSNSDDDGPSQTVGVVGTTGGFNGNGVSGRATNSSLGIGTSGFGTIGVYGDADPGGFAGNLYLQYSGSVPSVGVWGRAILPQSTAIYGLNTAGGPAGQFDGSVTINGNLTVNGILAKSAGSFVIDDPIDPTNKYLYHSFVESPDMMNIYNGNVTTDMNGDADVTLPPYFSALNRDCRYQLTVIGQFAQAIVSKKVVDGRFSIRTDKANVEVSWQVTGIRQDAFANANRIAVEVEKPVGERGSYLHPELFPRNK